MKIYNKSEDDIEKDYFNFEAFDHWLKNRDFKDNSKWFFDVKMLEGYYQDIIPLLTTEPKNIGRIRHALQHLVTV